MSFWKVQHLPSQTILNKLEFQVKNTLYDTSTINIVFKDLQRTDGTKQIQQLFTNTNSKLAARHLKITISRSYDHFVAVYHLKVDCFVK